MQSAYFSLTQTQHLKKSKKHLKYLLQGKKQKKNQTNKEPSHSLEQFREGKVICVK